MEEPHLIVNFRGISCDHDQISPVLAQIDGALEQAQPLLDRTDRVAVPGAVRARCCVLVTQTDTSGIPQRARGATLWLAHVKRRYLPVPSRQRQIEYRLPNRFTPPRPPPALPTP